jgi:DNA-directed RNA polymerase specialized sigma24 family protein
MGARTYILEQPGEEHLTARESFEAFNDRFSRSRGLLCFIAYRMLGEPEEVELAIRNSWLRASRNPPKFDSEGAFRSWLLRILIDEALAILHRPGSREYTQFD